MVINITFAAEIKTHKVMKIFNDLKLKFEQGNWPLDPELAVIDTILEKRPDLIEILKNDIIAGVKISVFGRKDTPTVEQIVRGAIYKELKGLEYRGLAYHQSDREYVQYL